MEHLTINSRAGVIVPEGIIFQSANAYKALRKLLVENGYLFAVVSLPAGVFQPYAGVKTSILLMDKSLAKRAQYILFVKIENEGFDLGAQRRVIDKNDLPLALKIVKKYQQALKDGKDFEFSEEESKIAHLVTKEKISETGDYNLSGDRYKEVVNYANQKWPMVELKEIADIGAGNSAPQDKELFKDGEYPFFRTSDVGVVHISDNLMDSRDKLNEAGINGLKLFHKNTILFPKSGASTFLNHRAMLGIDGYISSHLATIIPNETKILPKFLFNLLKKIDAKSLTNDQNYPSLKTSEIAKIKIPLPPLFIQQEIAADIEGYQKIIDGARQVVENYKPRIKVDEGWEVVELGDACEIATGKLDANASERDGIYPFFTCSKTEIFRINSYAFDCEALLLSGNNAVGDFDVKYYKGKFNAYQRTYIITIKDEFKTKITYALLNYYLQNSLISLKQQSIGGLTKYLTKNMITSIKISIPTMEIQKQIVARIEEEQKLVDANKKLIELFDGKIKAKIAEVWG